MLKFCFILLLCALSFEAAKGAVCTTDSDCGSNECCYIKPEFMVVSKRDGPLTLPELVTQGPKTGVCESYRSLHEQCYGLEKANGHCGCPDNMPCQFVPAATPSLPVLGPVLAPTDLTVSKKKRSIYMPGPGTYQCEYKHS